MERVTEFAERRRRGLILAGGCGTGKTHLAQVVTAYLAPGCLMTSEPAIVEELHASYSGEGSEERILAKLAHCDALILDDVGAAHVKADSRTWIASVYWRILDRRAEYLRPTLFTTNLTLAQLAEWIGDRAMSRMVALCGNRGGYVDMFGVDDHRKLNW